MKAKDEKNKSLVNESLIWFVKVFFITFILSTIFSYISTNGIDKLLTMSEDEISAMFE